MDAARKKRRALIVALALAILALYLLSTGPVFRSNMKFIASGPSKQEAEQRWNSFMWIYAPVRWLRHHIPPFKAAHDWYQELWYPRPSPDADQP